LLEQGLVAVDLAAQRGRRLVAVQVDERGVDVECAGGHVLLVVRQVVGDVGEHLDRPEQVTHLLVRPGAAQGRGHGMQQPYVRRAQLGHRQHVLVARVRPRGHRVLQPDESLALVHLPALLHELMRRPGEVLSRTHLIDHVWDFAYDGGSNVVAYTCATCATRWTGRSAETPSAPSVAWATASIPTADTTHQPPRRRWPGAGCGPQLFTVFS
jgi:hypothetical protein